MCCGVTYIFVATRCRYFSATSIQPRVVSSPKTKIIGISPLGCWLYTTVKPAWALHGTVGSTDKVHPRSILLVRRRFGEGDQVELGLIAQLKLMNGTRGEQPANVMEWVPLHLGIMRSWTSSWNDRQPRHNHKNTTITISLSKFLEIHFFKNELHTIPSHLKTCHKKRKIRFKNILHDKILQNPFVSPTLLSFYRVCIVVALFDVTLTFQLANMHFKF